MIEPPHDEFGGRPIFTTLTLRHVPVDVVDWLRRLAREEGPGATGEDVARDILIRHMEVTTGDA